MLRSAKMVAKKRKFIPCVTAFPSPLMALSVLANGSLHNVNLVPGRAAEVAVRCGPTRRLHAIFWGAVGGVGVTVVSPGREAVVVSRQCVSNEGALEADVAGEWVHLQFAAPTAVNFREGQYIDRVAGLLSIVGGEKRAGATRVDDTVCHAIGLPHRFADKALRASSSIFRFDSGSGECCAARKQSQSLNPVGNLAAPTGAERLSIEDIASKAASPEAVWKQSAASFSTMMRYFQRRKTEFEWGSDADEQRTLISRQ